MSKPSPALMEFMETYGVLSDEVWEVRAGGAWAIKHSALERVASERGIVFSEPEVHSLDVNSKHCVLLVSGTLPHSAGLRKEWSFGEAAPYNNKNAYPVAMAEKRAKDRVILKLLSAHGTVYSEEEADEFKEATLPKKDARDIYAKLQAEYQAITTVRGLVNWGNTAKSRIAVLPEDWQEILRTKFKEYLDELRAAEGEK